MTADELEFVKRALKRQSDAMKELWLEKQLLRNLIIDSGWIHEADLDSRIERGKRLPENAAAVAEQFAADDEALARIGLADWLASLESRYPRTD